MPRLIMCPRKGNTFEDITYLWALKTAVAMKMTAASGEKTEGIMA